MRDQVFYWPYQKESQFHRHATSHIGCSFVPGSSLPCVCMLGLEPCSYGEATAARPTHGSHNGARRHRTGKVTSVVADVVTYTLLAHFACRARQGTKFSLEAGFVGPREKGGGKAVAIGASVRENASMIEGLTATMECEFEMVNKYRPCKDEKDNFYAAESTAAANGSWRRALVIVLCGTWRCCTLRTEHARRPTCIGHSRAPWGHATDKLWRVRTQGRGETLGFIRDTCSCFNLTFTVRDEGNSDILHANGGCCQ